MQYRGKKRIILADWRRLYKLVNNSDFVIEVVDARNPLGTRSLKLEDIIRSKALPYILVLNKIDLVPKHIADEWIEFFHEKGVNTIGISATTRKGTLKLRKKIIKLLSEGEKKKWIGLVAGVPKTGKSSIINVLKGRHSASTSPYPGKPGYTHSFTLYRIDVNIYLYDTPGIFPDAKDYLERTIRIYSPEKIDDPVKYAVKLIERNREHLKHSIEKVYGIDAGLEPYEILEQIAVKRGWLEKKSGEPLIDEAARTVIRDYLKGKIPFYYSPYQKIRF